MKQEFQPFHTVASRPFDYARDWKSSTGRKVVGHFCSYTPEEIIHATGALPFRIFGSGETISGADAHLQAYSCSFVRSALADALSGRLAFLDGTVFPHTCDTIQRLSDIWRITLSIGFHADIGVPVKLDSAAAAEYLTSIFKKFSAELADQLGSTVSPDALERSVKLYNRMRRDMQRIFSLRRNNPTLVAGADLQALVMSSMIMDRDVFAQKLSALADNLQTEPQQTPPPLKRLVLSGGMCNLPAVRELIEGCGAIVVWDDGCSGERYFEGRIDPGDDIIAAIAARYLERIECPAKHAGLFRRGQSLVDIAKTHRADGVIFLFMKFCDPHGFDYPYLKRLLDDAGIGNLLLELEAPLPADEQLKTRVQAFLETL